MKTSKLVSWLAASCAWLTTIGIRLDAAPPVFSSQPMPAAQTVAMGTSVSLNCAVQADPIRGYPQLQWYHGTQPVQWATSWSFYFVADATTAGNYTVKATNADGTVESNVAAVAVFESAPAITVQPTPGRQEVLSGTWVHVAVSAVGAPPLTYQWRRNGADIAGALGTDYSFSANEANAGDYTVVVTNTYGSATSWPATVALSADDQSPPVIVQGLAPLEQTVLPGTGMYYSVGIASSSGNPRYQWYRDGLKLGDATYSNYSFVAGAETAGSYTVKVTNDYGAVTSEAAVLHVSSGLDTGPAFQQQPLPAEVTYPAGTSISYYASATSAGSVTYQWLKDGVAVPGATSWTYSFALDATTAGTYVLRATDLNGSTLSNPAVAQLSTQPAVAPVVSGPWGPTTFSLGASVSGQISLAASGTASFTYQWYRNGVALSGATSGSSLNLPIGSDADKYGDYVLTVTNAAGSGSSRTIHVVPETSLRARVDVYPDSVTAVQDRAFDLQFTSGYWNVWSFQWYRNGVAVPGATSSGYHVSTAGPTDAGSYICTATLSNGQTVSTSPVTVAIAAKQTHQANLAAATLQLQLGSINLNASENDSSRPGFQWRKDGVALAGGTYSWITVGGATAAGTYTYTWGAGSPAETSAPTIIVINPTAPRFSNEPGPEQQVVPSGYPVSLSAEVASGDGGSCLYHWRRNGVPIAGALQTTYSFTSSAATAGQYDMVATNSVGSTTSRTVTVAVEGTLPPPAFTRPLAPEHVTYDEGAWATLQAEAYNGGQLTYSWYHGGSLVSSGTWSSSYNFSVTPATEGEYSVTVTAADGSVVTSGPVVVASRRYAPAITAQPTMVSATYPEGVYAYFGVTAIGSPGPTYQWYHNGVPMSVGSNSSLNFVISPATEGDYYVVVSNVAGSVTSRTVTVHGTAVTPVIGSTSGNRAITVIAGESVSFQITPYGSPPLTVQWYRDGVAIPGANGQTLVVAADTSAVFTAQVSNGAGSVTSQSFTLTVNTSVAPQVVTPPSPQALTVAAGTPVSYSVGVVGGAPMAYQWYRDGGPLTGQTRSSITVEAQAATAGSYTVRVTNAAGSVTSPAAQLAVLAVAPRLTNASSGAQSVYIGDSVSFFATASGSAPFTVQWYRNGQPVAGANGLTLDLVNVQPADAGLYVVTVTNSLGTVSSTGVTLYVTAPPPWMPWFSFGPQSRSTVVGGVVVLQALAFGPPDPAYQWLHDGVAISGATGDMLTIVDAQLTDAGIYQVRATNSAGSTLSEKAQVTVSSPDRWQWLHPVPRGEFLNAVAYNGSCFVAVGVNGRIVRSPDGAAWTDQTEAIGLDLVDIAATGGRFVAVGKCGTVVTSPDGIAWSEAVIDRRRDLQSVAAGTGTFVAVDSTGALFVSTDGEHWAESVRPPGFGDAGQVAFGNGIFVAVDSQEVIASPDGVTWTVSGPLVMSGYSQSLVFTGSRFLVWPMGYATMAQDSPDGVTWRQFSLNDQFGNWSPLIVDGAAGTAFRFARTADSKFGVLARGTLSWASLAAGRADDSWSGIASDGTHWVLVGSAILTSTDLVTWTEGEARPVNAHLSGIAYGPAGYIAVGSRDEGYGSSLRRGVVLQSDDGESWAETALGYGLPASAVAYGNGRYVVLTDGGTAFVSTDGQTWEAAALPALGTVTAMTFGNGLFVCISNGRSFASADGLHWSASAQAVYVGAGSLVFDGTHFVVLIGNTTVGFSTDGIAWQTQDVTGVSMALQAVGYANGVFAGLSFKNGTVTPLAVSTDGVHWTEHPEVDFGPNARQVIVAGGQFLVFGSPNVAWRSGDGLTWKSEFMPSATPVAAAAGAAGIVTVGPTSQILVTPGPAVIMTQPESQAVEAGGSVTLTIATTGDDPAPRYQWRRNGVNLPGATSPTLTIGHFGRSAAGRYDAVVTDENGTVTSVVARLWIPGAWEDFNGDRQPDLILQNSSTGERKVWLMNGTAPGAEVSLGTVPTAWQIAGAADFNGDGQTDILWQNTQTGERGIWLMIGTNVADWASLGTVPLEWQFAGTADFNGDGHVDILFENTRTGERGIWLMIGTNVADWASLGTVPLEWRIAGAADFNGDGQADVLFENTRTGERGIWLMIGTNVADWASLGTVPLEWRMKAALDLDGDGQTDVLFDNTRTGERGVWLMIGTNVVDWASLGTKPTAWHLGRWDVAGSATGLTADFNGDGQADLVWQNASTGERKVWLMNGTALGSEVSLGTVPTAWQIAGAGDFNGDGQTDILFENTQTGERGIWLMIGTNVADWASLGTLPLEWRIATVADFNGDGKVDLLMENTQTGERKVRLMNGTTLGSEVSLRVVATAWQIAGAADFTGDGQTDILWQNTQTGERGVWVMIGNAVADWASLGTVSTDWQIAGTGDYDGDGQTDVLWQNSATGERKVWLMNGTTHTGDGAIGVVTPVWQMKN